MVGCEGSACSVFGLIRKEMAVTETTDTSNDKMTDPVTGEIIDQRELAERSLQHAKEQGGGGTTDVDAANRRSFTPR